MVKSQNKMQYWDVGKGSVKTHDQSTMEQVERFFMWKRSQQPISPWLLVLGGILVSVLIPSLLPTLAQSLVFFLGGLGVFVWSWVVYRDWATPMNLFALPWLFDLGLFHLQLLSENVQGKLEPFTYIAILGCISSFLGGSFIAGYKRSRVGRNQILNAKVSDLKLSPSRMRSVVILSFLGGLTVWGYLFWRIGGLSVFLNAPNVYRRGFLLPLVDDLYKLLFLSGFLAVYYLFNGGKKKRGLVIAIYLTAFLLIGSRLARYDLFLFVSISLMIVHMLKRIPLRTVIVVLFILLLVFVTIQFYRADQFGRESDHIASGIAHAPQSMPWLVSLYTYTIPNIRNVQIGIENTTSFEWGRNLLFPVWSFTRTTNLMGFTRHDFAFWQDIYGLGILRPFLIDFYRDFGLVGATLLPFLIGFFGTRLYHRARRGRMPDIFSYALLSYCLIFSLIDNTFSDSAVWLFAGLFFVTGRLCQSRENSIEDSKTQDLE